MYDRFTVMLAVEMLDLCSHYNQEDKTVMEVKLGISRWADTGDIEFLKDAYWSYYAATGFTVMGLPYKDIMNRLNKREENQNV